MNCPRCDTSNVESAAHCVRCGAALVPASDAETFAGASMPPLPRSANATPVPPRAPMGPAASNAPTAGAWGIGAAPTLEPDQVDFGPRYRIERMLGEGGMGAVYKAYDKELDRTVALKLIRPGLALDPAVAQRFKQELLLASKVSHKNILRIHDLGDAAGMKFISMAYVEGEDLHGLLTREGKLPVERGLNIARQLCAALAAAHNEGVVHRDFKPQNILLDKSDNVYVSDFGLAKSLEHDTGMTRSGEFLGTPRYMAPEQVEGKKIDHRVDLYALGLIMYEMLTGDVPFHADSTLQLMYKRVHEAPKNPKEINPDLPDWVVRVIMKCLERDPDQRYATAAAVLQDLVTTSAPVRPRSVQISIPRIGLTLDRSWLIGLAALLVAAGLWAVPSVRHRLFGRGAVSTGPHQPVSVLVADFTNHTGDPNFDGTLEPMFNVALEGASFINAFNRGTARKLAQKLPHPTDKLDEQPARLVAVSQGVNAVVTGEISRRGDSYSVSAMALDAVTGNVLANSEVTAGTRDELLRAIPKLVAPVRNALGDTTPVSAQIESAGGAFSAANLEAVHQYSLGMEQQFAGKYDQALQSFSKAAELDPNFARAYAGMAGIYGNVGKLQDSEKYIKLAMEHVDRMTDRERYRVRGAYYLTVGEFQKCTEEYGELVRRYPRDNIGHINLAYCLSYLRNLPRAVQEARLAVETNPPPAAALANLSLFSSYGGDFQGGERAALQLQQLNPASEFGYLAQAFSQLGRGQLSEALQTYDKLKRVSELGASMAASGMADLALYQGRFAEAAHAFEEGAAADLAAKSPEAAADKFSALAYAELLMHRERPALIFTEKALANNQAVKTRFLAARTFVEAGEIAKAKNLAAGLASEFYLEPQSYAKLIEGEIALKQENARVAIQLFTDASRLLDTWISHFDLGRAYLEAGLFVEADSEFDRCIKRRGETLALFLDEVPTFSYLPLVYYYQGRAREGLKSPGAAESYHAYLNLRAQAGEDPLLAEIRRRMGQ